MNLKVEAKVEITQELKFEYPCDWEYKLFIAHEHDAHGIVQEVFGERFCALKKSQASKNGTYMSYSLTLLVHNNDERTALFQAFKSHSSIKFVL